MKVLVDMNLSPRWVSLLAAAGAESLHWSDVGAANATDAEIMSYAAAKGYVVLTHDLDFGAMLAATSQTKPSIVQLRASDVRPQTIGSSVLAALRQMESELSHGALITIDLSRTRIRVLPLSRF